MKKIIPILLVFLIIIQTMNKVWIGVSFMINQSAIAQTYCVNKEIKNNKCQGKCYLKKQLVKAEKQDHKPTSKAQKEKYEVLYYSSTPQEIFVLRSILCHSKQDYAYRNKCNLSSYYSSTFHPPDFI